MFGSILKNMAFNKMTLAIKKKIDFLLVLCFEKQIKL